jgi:ascorbate-specific PTS system EIIC-type component UlaA
MSRTRKLEIHVDVYRVYQALDKHSNLYHHETRMAVLDYRFRIKALVIAGVLAALLVLVVDSSVGPRPLVWLNFKYGTVVIHVPWLIALFFISAVATLLAKRNGARLSQCLLVGISSALIIGTLFSLLMALIVVMVASGGHRVYPRDFIGHMLVSWLVIPVGAALLGTLPSLLGAPSIKTSGKQIST